MAYDVFISYSHKDKIEAETVCAGLEAAGIRCWIAPRDIAYGEWGEAIIKGIEQCRVMVLVFSSNANQSPQIRKEVERAVNKEKPILPFRIENVLPNTKLEYFLGNIHWLDALTPPMSAHIARLTETIQSLLKLEPSARENFDFSSLWKFSLPTSRTGRRWTLAGGGGLLIVLACVLAWWIVDRQHELQRAHDQHVIALAEAVRNDILRGAFNDANKTLASLASLAPSSGHTFYFEGEMQRFTRLNRNIYQAIDWFLRYVDDPRNAQILSSDRLDGQACYETAEGFCRKRTGWVLHLLANIYYRQSADATIAPERRREHLDDASRCLDQSLKFYPKGFAVTDAAPGQLIDNAWGTSELAELIKARQRQKP
jgi:hypothetical protein